MTTLLLAGVGPERPSGGDLTEFVAHHRLGHVYRDVLATVVHTPVSYTHLTLPTICSV